MVRTVPAVRGGYVCSVSISSGTVFESECRKSSIRLTTTVTVMVTVMNRDGVLVLSRGPLPLGQGPRKVVLSISNSVA